MVVHRLVPTFLSNFVPSVSLGWAGTFGALISASYPTPRQNVYACAGLSISGLFFSHTFQSKSPARFILCAACGSVVLLYAASVFVL